MRWTALFCVLTVLAPATLQAQVPAPCATPTFGPGRPNPVGIDSGPLVAADLDGNGSVDLVTANGNGLSILINNGDGTFATARFVPTGHSVGLIGPADVNGDGVPDLVGTAAIYPAFFVVVLVGDGTGGFSLGATFASLARPVGVATGDFNGDAHIDLGVALDGSPGVILVRAGDGAGGFGAPVVLETTNRPTEAGLIAADFNHDGSLDLAVAGSTVSGGTVEVRLGNGDGTFQAPAAFPVGNYLSRFTSADINGDGHLDLAILTSALSGNTLSLLFGDGSGSFVPQAVLPLIDEAPSDLDVSDFNGDGFLDVAVSARHLYALPHRNLESTVIDVLPGNGSGGFGDPLRVPVWGSSGGGGESVVADYDGDGKADLAGGNGDHFIGQVYMIRNMCGSAIDLSITLSGPKPLIDRRPATYTIAVENRGPDPAPEVSVDIDVDPAPTLQIWSLTPAGGTCQRIITGERFSCILDQVAAGETRVVTLVARPNPNPVAVATVMAQAGAGGVDPSPTDQAAADSTLVQRLGGEGFVLRALDSGGVELQWTGGDAQSGYYVVRRVGDSTTVFPDVGTPLAASATSFTDNAPAPGSANCYVVVPLDASGAFLGRSNMPCLHPSTASPSAAPSNPTLEVVSGDRPAARLTWDAVAGATAYAVRIFAADGQKYWQGTTGTQMLVSLFGASSCYAVVAMDGSNPIGNSHTLCAVAGIGNIPF